MILTVTLNAAIDKRYVVRGFEEGEVNRVVSCSYTPGGKGLNVSKPAVIAGAEVIATGFAGGHAGNYITEEITKLGIRNAFYHVDKESRSCINIWDEVKEKQTEYLEPGFTIEEAEWQGFFHKYGELLEQVDVVSISGSVPKGLDSTAYVKMITLAKEKGKNVILDTSGELLKKGIQAKPTMVKPNIDEIRMLTGKPCNNQEEILEAAQQLHGTGIDIVVISLGADGSLMVCNDGVFKAQVPKIKAVNTVGCGDSMIAGFDIGLERGMSPVETLKLASAISAASAMTEDTGKFYVKDMEELLPKIEILNQCHLVNFKRSNEIPRIYTFRGLI